MCDETIDDFWCSCEGVQRDMVDGEAMFVFGNEQCSAVQRERVGLGV